MPEQPDPLDAPTIAKIAVAAVGILFILSLIPSGCTHEDSTIEAAHDAGYTKVKTTGYRLFGCGLAHSFFTGYGFSTGFEAEDKSGRPVSGVVCTGFGKGPFLKLHS